MVSAVSARIDSKLSGSDLDISLHHDKGVRLWNPATSKNSGLKKFTGGDKPANSSTPAPRPPKFGALERRPQQPEPSSSRAPPPLPPRLPPRPSASGSGGPPVPPRPALPPRPGQQPFTNLPTETRGPLPPASNQARGPPAPPEVHPPPATAPQDQADLASGECLKCRDYSAVDAHARQYPRETLAYHGYTIPQLANELTSHLDNWTDRARVIFSWLADNIVYDVSVYFPRPGDPSPAERNRAQGAQTVFATGMAVCAGYAGLYEVLARHAGLECRTVSGYGKGFGFAEGSRPPFDVNHAWNAVQLDDGEWHLLDACWGAGAMDASIQDFKKGFDPTMFCAPGEEFGRRHFPTDPAYQLRGDGTTISWDQFLDDCDAPQVMNDFKVNGYSETALDPARKTLSAGTHTFTLWHACPHEDARSRQEDHYLPLLGVGDGKFHAFDWWEGTGCWSLTFTTGPGDVHIWFLKEVGGRDARGISKWEYERNIQGRQAMSFGGLVKYICV